MSIASTLQLSRPVRASRKILVIAFIVCGFLGVIALIVWRFPRPLQETYDPILPPADFSLKDWPFVLDPREYAVGEMAPDLAFCDRNGKRGLLSDFRAKAALVVAITDAECPLSKRYMPRLLDIAGEFAPRDVAFLFVDSGRATDSQKRLTWADRFSAAGRYIVDADGELASGLRASSTTDVFVLDPARTLTYRGAVDDQYGLDFARAEPRNQYLRDALTAVLAGKLPARRATIAPGCDLDTQPRPLATGAVTFHNRISRIIQNNCQTCHRDGGGAPFVLSEYDQLANRKRMVRRVITDGVMPPWFASHDSGPFSNDRRLSARDKSDLLAWLDADCPEGEVRDAPRPIAWPAGWQIGEPDLVVRLPEPIAIPAQGIVEYQEVKVVTELPTDQWITAIEIRPTARENLHHCILNMRYAADHPRVRGKRLDYSIIRSPLAGYVPGQSYRIYTDGQARFLPKGAKLIFQLHYVTNGTATTDQTEVGFVFARQTPRYEVFCGHAMTAEFQIPPGASNYPITSTFRFPTAGLVLGFLPHMHLRGKAFRFELVLPDGSTQNVFELPRWDFNWQFSYVLREPLLVPRGAELRATGWFDNSAANPANPDPTATVTFGHQTFNEMMAGYFEWIPAQDR